MREKILEQKQNFVFFDSNYLKYTDRKFLYQGEIKQNLIEILKGDHSWLQEKTEDVINKYNLKKSTTSEGVRKIITTDGSRLFLSILCLLDMDLFQPIDVDDIIKESLESSRTPPINPKECKEYTLAKNYIDIAELREDDDKRDIFFDKKYDQTRYDIIHEFQDESELLTPEEFKKSLKDHLITQVGLDPTEAERETNAMIEGKKRIIEGDYAYILDDEHKYVYYKRNDELKWVKDIELEGKKISEVMFCNLKESCINIKKKCGSIEINKKNIQKELIKEILSSFEERFHISITQLKKKIKQEYEYNLSNISQLERIKNNKLIRIDLINQKLGTLLGDRTLIISPFEQLKNYILSQSDFVKKQSDILNFITVTCRTNIPTNPNENEYWYYCIKTGVPLLPTFYKELADSFYKNEYNRILDKIVAKRGKMSDDGDKIVDKYSGYIIRTIEYDESEGYDEAGFKIISRAILEEDIEKTIAELEYKLPESIQSQSSKKIINIIKTFDKNLGIQIDSQIEFIIQLVNTILETYLPSKAKYEKQIKSLKKKKSYESIYNEALILTTICAYLIAIQTTMPSIRAKITFPGCVRSFTGYPLDGEGDISALKYMACVSLKLRSKPHLGIVFLAPRGVRKMKLLISLQKNSNY